jgi:uncharacterized protein (TIRG00374 family)
LFFNVAKLALSVLVIVLVAAHVDLQATWRQMASQSAWTILLAVGIIVLQILAAGLRWHAVMKGLGGSILSTQALRFFYVSVFFNSCLSGALGGDLVRTWLANRSEANLKIVVSSVILDRVVALAAVALLVLLTFPAFANHVGLGTAIIPALLALATIAGIMLGAQLYRLPVALQQYRLLRGVSSLGAATRDIFLRPAAAAPVLALATLAQVALSLAAFVIARGLGMPVTLLDCLVLMQPVALVTALPISVGGWGVREAAMVAVFGLTGLPSSSALALSVQLGLLSLVASLPGGLLFLLLRSDQPREAGAT